MSKAAGTRKEYKVRDWYLDRDYIVIRPGGSLGAADLVAMKDGSPTDFVQVKGSAQGPYQHFQPKERANLIQVARWAGARPLLAWWPPRGKLRFIGPEEWPAA